jgi:hypothetical protein
MKPNKLMMIILVLGALAPTLGFFQIAMAAPARYRVTTYFTIDRSGDGSLDNTLEVYGEVRINGAVNSSIDRSRARRKEAGQTLDMGQKVVTGSNVDIKALLMDVDDATSDDSVFQMPNTSVSLAATSLTRGQEKTFSFRSPAGDEGATLHVRIDKL